MGATAQGKVDELEKKMKILTDEFEGATNEANELKENAAKTEKKLTLAERLVNGLSDEKVRWAQNIEMMKVANLRLIGDCLVCASFVSYIGAFSAEFRKELIDNIWLPDLKAKEIPSSDLINPLTLLTDPATMATWGNEGLPTDQLSIENAVIITSCSRWPLIVDPQLQGVTWIKSREAENEMRIITLSGRFLDVVERCISMGDPLLIRTSVSTLTPCSTPCLLVPSSSVAHKCSSSLATMMMLSTIPGLGCTFSQRCLIHT